MEDQEINKQLKSQNLKGKISLILGVIHLILLLISWEQFAGWFTEIKLAGALGYLFGLIFGVLFFYGGTFLIAVIVIIFGFLGRKSTMGKIGIILCIINLSISIFVWYEILLYFGQL